MRNFENSEIHLAIVGTTSTGLIVYSLGWKLETVHGWIIAGTALIGFAQMIFRYTTNQLSGFETTFFYVGTAVLLIFTLMQ